ncbi:hypothetical protein [Methanosphaera sp.]|jgi:hypothetical protein|uniref:hypothetical protein n=1 Tax=Methanosphaera sp. TaxID=2666342 RepID=UPI003D8FC911
MEYQIDINKFAIIIIVGIFAITGLFVGEQNLTSVCIGGLIGYLSKEYTENSEYNEGNDENIHDKISENIDNINEKISSKEDNENTINNDQEQINNDDEVA